jgi:hypothetical protein
MRLRAAQKICNGGSTWVTRVPALPHSVLLYGIHEGPLHLEDEVRRCSTPGQRTITPTVFEGTVDIVPHLYIFPQFVEQLDNAELTHGYFQQDGATCHTS